MHKNSASESSPEADANRPSHHVTTLTNGLTELHNRIFNGNRAKLAKDPVRAEALMEHVIAAYPRQSLPAASLADVANHYVRQHFPNVAPERRADLVARIEAANVIRQSLYSGPSKR